MLHQQSITNKSSPGDQTEERVQYNHQQKMTDQSQTLFSRNNSLNIYPLADLQIALGRIRQSSVNYHSKQGLNILSDVQEFRQFGPAIYFFFSFVKKCIFLFLVLTVMSIIPILYNRIAGTVYSSQAWGINVEIARISIGAHSSLAYNEHVAKNLNVAIVGIIIISFFTFLLYWQHKLTTESGKLSDQLNLGNHNEIVVEQVPQTISKQELRNFMQKFGTVKEVIQVINQGEKIRIAKGIYEKSEMLKQLQKQFQLDKQNVNKISSKISKIKHQITKLNEQFINQAKTVEQIVQKKIRYYVQFQSNKHHHNIIKQFQKYQGICSNKYPQELLLSGAKISVKKCQIQPNQINWQNQHVQFKDVVLPNIAMFVLVNVVGIATMLLISVFAGASQPVYYNPKFESNTLSQFQIIARNNLTQLASWCLSNNYAQSMQTSCSSFSSQHSSRILLYFLISILILLSRMITKKIIIYMIPYLKFKNQSQQSLGVFTHLFMNYTMISVLIALSLQTQLFGQAMGDLFVSIYPNSIIKSNLKQLWYHFDYTSQWYLDYGFQLTFNLLIAAIFPHILSPLIEYLIFKWKMYRSKNIKLQSQLQRYLQLNKFELQDHYATCFLFMLVGMIFAGGMPIMIPIILLGLVLRFYVAKIMFVFLSKMPITRNITIAQKSPKLLIFIITAYLLNSLWAFGAQSIFITQSQLFSDKGINSQSNAHTFVQALMVFFRRLCSTWPLVFIFIFGILLVILRSYFANVSVRITNKLLVFEKKSTKTQQIDMNHAIEREHQHQEGESKSSYHPSANESYAGVWKELQKLQKQ